MAGPVTVRSEPDFSQSFEPFQERLAEAVSWCLRSASKAPLGTALRTPAFVPPPALPWPETVRALADTRLQTMGRSWRRTLDPLGGGELLIYLPRGQASGGAAQAASEGYFDARDLPPWDTWVAWVQEESREYLVCWVPLEGVPLAAAGIAAAPGSLAWLVSSENPITPRLRR